jgi:hypothetical protein
MAFQNTPGEESFGVVLSTLPAASTSKDLSSSSNPPKESLTPMRQSNSLASIVLAEPKLFQFDSISTGGVSGAAVDGGAHGGEGPSPLSAGAAAGTVCCVDNPFEPSPDSIIERFSYTVNDMLGLDVSQCYSSEAELLQHLPQQHVVLAKLSYQMDSAGAPKFLLDCISCLRIASIHRGFDFLSSALPIRNALMERLLAIVSVPAPASVPIPLKTGQMKNVLTNCFPSLLQRHLLSDAYSDLSNLDLPDPASPFSSKPSFN